MPNWHLKLADNVGRGITPPRLFEVTICDLKMELHRGRAVIF
jgi:hypothetical protein